MTLSLFTKSSLLLAFLFVASQLPAQNFPRVDKSPADIAVYRVDEAPVIKVVYSRPAKNGRTVFGDLIPFGEVWRTGANEATDIRLYAPATLNETEIAPGNYSLFTIPGEDTWTIILSSQTDVWGSYNYTEDLDVARIDVPKTVDDNVVENFAIAFQEVDGKVHMVLAWDTTRVAVPFQF